MSDAIKTDHATLLNTLDSMAGSPYYAFRRRELVEAQTVILAQEATIKLLKEQLRGKETAG